MKYVFQLNQGHVIKIDAIGLQKLKTLWCCPPPKNFASLKLMKLHRMLHYGDKVIKHSYLQVPAALMRSINSRKEKMYCINSLY